MKFIRSVGNHQFRFTSIAARRLFSTNIEASRRGIFSYLNENKGAIGSIVATAGAGLGVMNWIVGVKMEPFYVKFDAVDKKIDIKFAETDKKMDKLESSLEKKIDEKFATLDKKIDDKVAALDNKMDMFISRIDRIEDRYAKFGERLAQIEKK